MKEGGEVIVDTDGKTYLFDKDKKLVGTVTTGPPKPTPSKTKSRPRTEADDAMPPPKVVR